MVKHRGFFAYGYLHILDDDYDNLLSLIDSAIDLLALKLILIFYPNFLIEYKLEIINRPYQIQACSSI